MVGGGWEFKAQPKEPKHQHEKDGSEKESGSKESSECLEKGQFTGQDILTDNDELWGGSLTAKARHARTEENFMVYLHRRTDNLQSMCKKDFKN